MNKLSDDGKKAVYVRKSLGAIFLSVIGIMFIVYSHQAGHSWLEYIAGFACILIGVLVAGYREMLELDFTRRTARFQSGWFNRTIRESVQGFAAVRCLRVLNNTVTKAAEETGKETVQKAWPLQLTMGGNMHISLTLGVFPDENSALKEAETLAARIGTRIERPLGPNMPVPEEF